MKQQLEEQESRVADFRLRNDGLLPEQRSANEAAIRRLQDELEHLGDETDDAELRALIIGQSVPAPRVEQKKAAHLYGQRPQAVCPSWRASWPS